jgi:hypothetical protein
MHLQEYVITHTQRGECQCGRCIDVGTTPDPVGHTVDLEFFKVSQANTPSAEEFRQLTEAHHGSYAQPNVFDGQEHGYIELGAWIGDQGMALQYMGLGTLLGVFELLTPTKVFGTLLDKDTCMRAGHGGIRDRASERIPPRQSRLTNLKGLATLGL